MTETRTTAEEVRDEIVEAIRKVQEYALYAVHTTQETAKDAIRYWAGTIQSMAPSVSRPDLPYARQLPKPEELVAGAFDFAEHLLATQRSLAERALQTLRPPAPRTRSASAPKAGSAG